MDTKLENLHEHEGEYESEELIMSSPSQVRLNVPKSYTKTFLGKKRKICMCLSIPCILILTIYLLSQYIFVKNIFGKSIGVNLKETSYSMTAQRLDDRIQDCQGSNLKITFPDLDYAMFGYNVVFGYPFETGHDPGLTRPIFATDYSEKMFTSDCRYEIPKGYVLVPDVSCVTSFTSDVVKNTQQLETALAASAEISGGGYGGQFSASASYQNKRKEMSASESVYILSQAKCNYYFAMLDTASPPKLHPSFVKGITMTNFDINKEVFQFFDKFGTHFITYALFGARFLYEHKMSKSEFQKESSDKVSVSAKASYSGTFSLSGGFKMSSSQQKAATNFQEKVETRTISIGAPPPENGDTMKWASTVKETPIPVKYKLQSIENLFTGLYMENTGIPYDDIRPKIKKAGPKYCKHLFDAGIVDSCSMSNNKHFKLDYHLSNRGYKKIKTTETGCINSCLDDPLCVMTDYHYEKNEKDDYNKDFDCFLYKADREHNVTKSKNTEYKTFNMFVFVDVLRLLNAELTLKNLYFERDLARKVLTDVDKDRCKVECQKDWHCAGFTYEVKDATSLTSCYLFQEDKIGTLKLNEQSEKTITVIAVIMPH